MDGEDLSDHYELLLLLSLSEASHRVDTLKKLIQIENFFLCLLVMGCTFVKFSASAALITFMLVVIGLLALHIYRDSTLHTENSLQLMKIFQVIIKGFAKHC